MTPFTTDLQLILSQRLNVSEDDIKAVCQRWKIEEMAFFGSVLREDFDKDSDVDVLVVFQEKHGWSLFDLMDLQAELENLFKRPVDILQKKELINPHRRQEILKTHQLVYGTK
jgi:hypothetical protein